MGRVGGAAPNHPTQQASRATAVEQPLLPRCARACDDEDRVGARLAHQHLLDALGVQLNQAVALQPLHARRLQEAGQRGRASGWAEPGRQRRRWCRAAADSLPRSSCCQMASPGAAGRTQRPGGAAGGETAQAAILQSSCQPAHLRSIAIVLAADRQHQAERQEQPQSAASHRRRARRPHAAIGGCSRDQAPETVSMGAASALAMMQPSRPCMELHGAAPAVKVLAIGLRGPKQPHRPIQRACERRACRASFPSAA